jgi:hypothetical protein
MLAIADIAAEDGCAALPQHGAAYQMSPDKAGRRNGRSRLILDAAGAGNRLRYLIRGVGIERQPRAPVEK